MNLKLKDITPAPWNTRGEITPESVKELAASIEEQGLINPITVWMDENGNGWYCIAGNRRLAALLSLGKKEVECTEFKGSEHEAKMVTVTENLQREDVSPIEEAALVQQCLDEGMTAEAIAAQTGRSTAWVNRRKRLTGLHDDFKSVADRFTTDQLERIASFEPEVQSRVAESFEPESDDWEEVKRLLQYEARDLATARFDTEACQACFKRTGAQADLWGVCDGCLGHCQDKMCFEKKVVDAREAEIERLTKCAKEVVRVAGYWQMPSDSDSSPKKSKQHPCAYVLVDYQGKVEVKWGESKAAKDEREKKEQERREAERAEERAASAREDGITDKLDAWKDGGDNSDSRCVGLADLIEKEVGSKVAPDARSFVTEAVIDRVDTWHNSESWVETLRAFPSIAKLAGVSEEDVAYLIEKYGNEENDNN